MKTTPIVLFVMIFALASLVGAQPVGGNPKEKEDLKIRDDLIARLQARIAQLEGRIRALEELPDIRIPREVRNNLRILSASLDQYCLDHHVTECRFEDLVGPGKNADYVRTHIADGESYEKLRFALDQPEWRIETTSGFVAVFKKEKFDSKHWAELWAQRPNQALEPTR